MRSKLDRAIESLVRAIAEKYPMALVESIDIGYHHYDARVVVRLPSDWRLTQLFVFQDWASDLTHDLLIDEGVDILVDAFTLTRNQQELVKWIYQNMPEISTETLPASGIMYDKAAAQDIYEDQLGRVNEKMIDLSKTTHEDKSRLLAKRRRAS